MPKIRFPTTSAETDGYVSREQTGGLRVGFSTTSEQLAQQLHWLLLRWGI